MSVAATVKLAPPPRRRSSLIVAIALSMFAVAALPFGLAAYQIQLARDSLVNQAQQTHLVAARSTADRLASQWTALTNSAEAAAQNPQLYEQPGAEAAREVLAGLLVGQTRLLAAATFYRDGEQDRLVQLARPKDGPSIPLERLRALGTDVSLFELDGLVVMGVARESERPGLRLALLSSAEALSTALQGRELGSTAQLFLLKGDQVSPLFDGPKQLPRELLAAVLNPAVDTQAVRSVINGTLAIGAFARMPDSDWSIASLQPVAEAERAATRMRQGAVVALLAVSLLVALLSIVAWRYVVRPMRTLLSLQRSVLNTDSQESSDLADLQDAFAQIQMYQRNREALREVFLGRYKLLSILGQGAMGSVFLAWDPRLRRHVAIKTIHMDTLDTERQAALARTLEEEAVAIANLKHSNIVGVFDLVVAGQFGFVVMEYVEGGNLRTVISRNGALSAPEVVLIAQSLLKALDAAHSAGLLHLDIKPGNVLMPPTGDLKLTDFGVCAWRFEVHDLVARGGLSGTPGFIAPEFVNGSPPTERSDLYSLGILLVECLTGAARHLPGAKTGDLKKAAKRPVQLEPELLQAEPELCAAILQLCALQPDQRPASAAEALIRFEALSCADGEQRLHARAAGLGNEHLDDAGGGSTAVSAASSATLAPPGSEAATTRPPPTAADSTLPPPGLAATREPPRT